MTASGTASFQGRASARAQPRRRVSGPGQSPLWKTGIGLSASATGHLLDYGCVSVPAASANDDVCEDWSVAVLLLTHHSALEHPTPHGHPERPDRIRAAIAGVSASGLEIVRADPPIVSLGDLERIHDTDYIAGIERFCASGRRALDPDTFAGPESWDAALRSAGAGYEAAAALRAGDAETAFIAMRPPGHHAERARAMGFCLFNNVAVTAARLIDEGDRVAIVDWDVHHGNGTQNTFYRDPNLLYVSLHESPQYPGTGHLHEIGAGSARGTTVNLPLPTGSSGVDYATAFHRVVVPVLRGFSPDWILVSAGYDAHRDDPLAGMRLDDGDYAAMAFSLARCVAADRIIFFLEGGYDLDAIRESVAATLGGALGADPPVADGEPSGAVATVVAHAVERLSEVWQL